MASCMEPGSNHMHTAEPLDHAWGEWRLMLQAATCRAAEQPPDIQQRHDDARCMSLRSCYHRPCDAPRPEPLSLNP